MYRGRPGSRSSFEASLIVTGVRDRQAPGDDRAGSQNSVAVVLPRGGRFEIGGVHDLAGDGGGRDHQGTRQIHLAWSASSGEVPIDGGDGHLFGGEGHAGTGANARSARWLDELGARFLEGVDVPLLFRVAADLLRAELHVQLDSIGHVLPACKRSA